jgi:hypothetical protein
MVIGVLGILGGGLASGEPLVSSLEREAVAIWRMYAACERSGEFRQCYPLLSKRAQAVWARQGVTTAQGYKDVKGSEEIFYEELTVRAVRRHGSAVILSVDARGGGERGRFVARIEYRLISEDGGWKVDRIWEGGSVFLP